jgi:hypothetical protein
MLTLFRPWRAGLELKTDLQLWSDAFNDYSFSQYFTSIMNNFNLKYECLDARDGYRAQLKKKQSEMARNGCMPSSVDYGEFNEQEYEDDLWKWHDYR